jgi:hypothetical protein
MEEGFSDAISSEVSEGFDDHLGGEDLFTRKRREGEPMFKRECEFMRRPVESSQTWPLEVV